MIKFESLFYKFNTCLQKKTTTCIASQAAQIYDINIKSKYIIYTFFNFECDFCVSFPMYCASIFISSNILSQIFKILFRTRNTNISVLGGAFFNRFIQLKSFFSDEKTSALKSETQISSEAIEN